MPHPTHPYDTLTLESLRERRSAKWRQYPADVLPAWVAEMDFPLAEPVQAALRELVERGDAGYVHDGDLAEAYADWAHDRLKWTVDPGRVTTVPDVMTGVHACLELFTRPGDGVVVNTPVYPPFFEVIEETGRQLVDSPLVRRDERWELDLDGLAAAFDDGARAYLLCNPHNPTGRVLASAELEQVAELAERYDVIVLADEVHGPLTYPRRRHVPFGSLGGAAAERAVVLTSASKAWNLPGLKCALLVTGSAAGQTAVARIPTRVRYGTGLYGVAAAVAAFTAGQPWLDDTVAYLDGNRRLLADLVGQRLPGVGYLRPEASYLAWLDCRALGLGADPSAVFLERGRVALNPGPSFGPPGAGFVRLNFATSRALLTEAVDRMARALDS